ncbi:MAG: gamma-glutamyl-gamma-aminobutyrate hydrolase, partial [Mycobacterium sp.]
MALNGFDVDGGDPRRPAAPRLRSPRIDGGDPRRPAAPR